MSERDSASFVFGSSALLSLCLKLQTKVKDYTNQEERTDGFLKAVLKHRFPALTQSVEDSKHSKIYNISNTQY